LSTLYKLLLIIHKFRTPRNIYKKELKEWSLEWPLSEHSAPSS
jgi:hypothetical protein